ncbi:MAG: carboxypeptidase regulatory-like domain-containing protein [Bacteroidales bacterium]|nr:carboxypeptidase regulatory-like domain-containing protein [Bacteroidales bacterium]
MHQSVTRFSLNHWLLAALLSVFTLTGMAQNPILSWRFANPQVITGDSLQFDVEVKCNLPGTYHTTTMVFFNYNTSAFGSNIGGWPPGYAGRKIRYQKLELLEGANPGLADKYNLINIANNKPYRLAIIFESSTIFPDPAFLNEVGTDWKGFVRFTIAISDVNQLAGIEFVPQEYGVGLMNSNQYYVDATHLSETKYGNPPDYAGIYTNDLLSFTLFQSGFISGTVTEQATGNPIADATVTAGSYNTTTAPDGTYSMEVLTGTYDVTADKACYDPQTQTGVVVPYGGTVTVNFALTGSPFGIIEGFITDISTGTGIGNALVTAGSYSTTTNASGWYQILNVNPGTYTVAATHPYYYSASVAGVTVTCNQTTTVNISMTPLPVPGTITGIVIDTDTGNPIPDADISAGGFSTTSQPDGTYSLVVPEGTYNVSATATCYNTVTQTGIYVPPNGTVVVNFFLTPYYGTLSGTVTDGVTMAGLGNVTISFGPYSTLTAPDGSYTVSNVTGGIYDVTASHPDYLSVTATGIDIPCGSAVTLDFTLYPASDNPVLYWRFANAQIIPGDSLQFDVELKCSLPGTYHSSTQIYFNYNTAAFGSNIAGLPPSQTGRKIRYEKLELLQGDIGGVLPKYVIVNDANNTPSRYGIILESTVISPSPGFMNEVGTEWKGFIRFVIAISNTGETAGIEFVPETEGIPLMNAGQYYVDATHPSETLYGYPPTWFGFYMNNLLDFPLNPPITTGITVFLQGPYNSGLDEMNNTLQNTGYLPLSHPYNPALPYYGNNTPVWLYSGPESVSSMPSGVVDWVILELRDAPDAASATGATRVVQKACLITTDGMIRDLDGVSMPFFSVNLQYGLFVVVHHRNHLSVMNPTPLSSFGGIYVHNFTTGAGQAYGGITAHKELEPGVWGMVAGDGNADKQINNPDKLDVWQINAGSSGYLAGDYSMDGECNNTDKNGLWGPNTGSGTQVPDFSPAPPGGFRSQVPD